MEHPDAWLTALSLQRGPHSSLSLEPNSGSLNVGAGGAMRSAADGCAHACARRGLAVGAEPPTRTRTPGRSSLAVEPNSRRVNIGALGAMRSAADGCARACARRGLAVGAEPPTWTPLLSRELSLGRGSDGRSRGVLTARDGGARPLARSRSRRKGETGLDGCPGQAYDAPGWKSGAVPVSGSWAERTA